MNPPLAVLDPAYFFPPPRMSVLMVTAAPYEVVALLPACDPGIGLPAGP